MSDSIPAVKLNQAIKHFGSESQLAEFLGISVEAIYNMQRNGREYLPDLRAFQVTSSYPDLAVKRRKKS